MSMALHIHPAQPSPWLSRWLGLLPPSGTTVLDLACGSGRHTRWLAEQGHRVTAVDRDSVACTPLADCAEVIVADIESGPWPLEGRQFGAIVVTNYLWRPLWPRILQSLMPGGVLLYETFAAGNETVGKPSRPDFLLQPGELLTRCQGLRVVAYEDGFLPQPERFVQRIAAVSEPTNGPSPARYALAATQPT